MDDIAARRQHDVRRRAALLADQLEGAVLVRLVGKHPPHQSVADDRQILAVTRGQRQHRLARRSEAGGGRPAARSRSMAARSAAASAARAARDPIRARTAARDSWRPGRRRPGPHCRRHRRRTVGEHLGRGGRPESKSPAAASASAGSRPPAPPATQRCPSPAQTSWACFSPKTRQIQASVTAAGRQGLLEPRGATDLDLRQTWSSHIPSLA